MTQAANDADKSDRPANKQNRQDPEPADRYRSALYRRARDLTRQSEQESVVDSEKVSAIKAAIEAGTYSVDPEKIAAKLLEQEVDFQVEDPGNQPTE